MDRQIVYPGAIPLETDILRSQKNDMIGLAKLAAAVLGTTTQVNGLPCNPNSPTALNVVVGAGEIYALANIDSTAYSSLAADTVHTILKQGILLDPVTLSTPAPATAGQSINYLIQATFSEIDGTQVVLPYYNASNPTQAYSGPNNTGSTNFTIRAGVCTVAVKTGISAATGTQVTPAADAGYVGLYAVTVAQGQTTVTAANISVLAGAPFLVAAAGYAGGRKQVFTSSGTFTVPGGVSQLYVSAVAGGGGAGGGAGSAGATSSVGGGGGGGGGAGQSAQRQLLSVTPGQVISVSIGAGGGGGGGGAASGTAGGTGGAGSNTVIGTITLAGGGGGAAGGPLTSNVVGGGGAGGGGGSGYPGGSDGTDGNYTGNGGASGSSPFGGGGKSGRAASTGPGSNGSNGGGGGGYGAGGGGGGGVYGSVAFAAGAGGTGAAGYALIEY